MAHARNIFLKARSHRMQYDQEGTIRFSFFMNDESWYILWISESLRYLILTEGVTRVWASQKIAVINGDKIWNSEWASGNVTSLAGSLLVWYLWYLHLQTRLRSNNKHCKGSFELPRLASHKKATALIQASGGGSPYLRFSYLKATCMQPILRVIKS